MPLDAGTRLGPYEIVAPLGAGGMGEVYRARDTRLDRTVAVKVLPAHVSGSADNRLRFEREARAISNLSHPNICALHDIGRQDEIDFLVMEFLEGQTLEDRLAAGSMPVREALAIGIEIAGALDAAHRHGVVHRDLKPGNIVLAESGAKLLDFGIAKVTEAAAAAGAGAGSPGGDARTATMAGAIVGTFQYMAPEQLEAGEIDARTDIFAFGAMLYEMLSGRKAFAGATPASVITAIMTVEPRDISALRPEVSPALNHVVRKCLAKAPRDRWQSARDLLGELQWIAGEAGRPAPPPPAKPPYPWAVAAVGAVFAALFGASVVPAYRHLTEQPVPRLQAAFTVAVPAGHSFQWFDTPAVSPSGEHIVFSASAADGTPRLFLRRLNSPGSAPLPGTEDAQFPFWSPDGRRVAFFAAAERRLKWVDLAGGAANVICAAAPAPGGAWSSEGVILFARPGGPLQRVAAEGGEPRDALPLAPGERSHAWPQFLPGGRFLFFSNAARDAGTHVAAPGSAERVRVLDVPARFASGFLLFAREEVLMARPFDPRGARFAGEAFTAAEPVTAYGRAPGSVFSVSAAGVLAFRPGAARELYRYTWFDRSGKQTGTAGEPGELSNPALSPDGRRLAYGRRDPQTNTRDIWVLDLARGSATRITFDPGNDFNPVFSPDGARIAFSSDRTGTRNLYAAPASGAGETEALAPSEVAENAEDWSGGFLVFNRQPRGSPADVYALPMAGGRTAVPLLAGDFTQDQAQVSPDGRWIAYKSDETGQNEVYVRGFDPSGKAQDGKWRVSVAGGVEPRWRADGRELYYLQHNTLMAVEVKGGGAGFEAGIPAPLFTAHIAGIGRNRYVPAPDGRRFLVQSPLEGAPVAPFYVVLNWDARRR